MTALIITGATAGLAVAAVTVPRRWWWWAGRAVGPVRRFVDAVDDRWSGGFWWPVAWAEFRGRWVRASRVDDDPPPPTTTPDEPAPTTADDNGREEHRGADEHYADELHTLVVAEPAPGESGGWEKPAETIARLTTEAEAVLDDVAVASEADTEERFLAPSRAKMDGRIAASGARIDAAVAQFEWHVDALTRRFPVPSAVDTQPMRPIPRDGWPLVPRPGKRRRGVPKNVPPWQLPPEQVLPARSVGRIRAAFAKGDPQ